MTTPTIEGLTGAAVTIATGANMNALGSGSLVLCAAFSNVQGDGQGGGYPFGVLKIHVDSMTVTAGGVIDGFWILSSDATTFEQGGTSVVPLKTVCFSRAPVAQTAAIDLDDIQVSVPICANIKLLLRNNALGAAFPANNNGYVKLYPRTDQIPSI